MARPPYENRKKVKERITIFFELEAIEKLGKKKIREISIKAVNEVKND
jgi:hypothetical protein